MPPPPARHTLVTVLPATAARLAPREWEVLGLMAQGCSNAGIATRLYLSGKTVEWYVNRIFAALSIPAGPDYNRRVCAVLSYLAFSVGDPDTALRVEPDHVR